MQKSANVLNDGFTNPTKSSNDNDFDSTSCGDPLQEKLNDIIRNKCQQHHSLSSLVVRDKHIRPASLPIKKCFNYAEDDDGSSGKLNDSESGYNLQSSELIQSQADSIATFISPTEGHFWKRYAEVSMFRKDTFFIDDGPNRRRSDSSFILAKQRLSPLQTGAQEINVEVMDDDLAPLLPGKREPSQDDIYQSQASLVSSSDGGILAEGEETSSESQVTDNSRSPPCVLGLVERLLRTHPVWFLPGIQRSGAVHLLQGKEEGNFIVRGSSQSKTMAVSVRLPQDTGPYIEHYLIQSNDGQLSLESSRFKFDSIPSLIGHYSQCCDELPVQLCLPKALREAKNRQQLSSLALLGQEFWRYPMAMPKPKTVLSPNSSHLNTPSDATQSSGIGLTFHNRNVTHLHNFGQEGNSNFAVPGDTPTDTISTMSCFTVGHGQQLLSPESIDSAVVISPTDFNQTGIVGKTSTFKAKRPLLSPSVAVHDVEKQIDILNANLFGNNNGDDLKTNDETARVNTLERQLKTPRPTPPNTLNIKPIRSPPAPPARRLKPSSVASTPNDSNTTFANNITVTTTVTFSVDNHANPQIIEMLSPPENNQKFTSFQNTSTRLPPDGECHMAESLVKTSQAEELVSDTELLVMQSSTDGNTENQSSFRKHMKFDSHSSTNRASRRSKRKESKHYQESDILESPSVYCRSNLGDKISDYEDIWTQDNNGNTTLLKGGKGSTFKPSTEKIPTLLSPVVQSPSALPVHSISNSQDLFKSNELNLFGTESVQLRQLHRDASSERSTPTEQHRNVLKTFFPSFLQSDKSLHNPMLEPRYRMGLCIPNTTTRYDQENRSETPPLNVFAVSSKQESPFYADPADVLNSIVRRSPFNRSAALPNNQRHSEPPKQLLSIIDHQSPQMWSSTESKNLLAASLDELKKPRNVQRKNVDLLSFERLSLEQTECNDYDNDLRWLSTQTKPEASMHQKNVKIIPPGQEIENRSVTVHQIIAKRLPHLDLPELPVANEYHAAKTNTIDPDYLSKTQRKSAYDNVEKNNAAYASSLINSSQSDDGTVFSEPWDSSQWETFLPQEGNAGTSDANAGKISDRCGSSNDSASNSMSLRRDIHTKKTSPSQKVATIVRSRSCRDREILCHPRNKAVFSGPGETIGTYALSLADDAESTFSRNISNFISCTKESKAAPQVVMRNMRQFMSGMKNYLVKHGEGEFANEVQKARSQLKSDEFLNLDSILEEVMHRLVILPLREHLYGLFVDYYTQSGDIQMLVEKVKQASGRGPAVFGIKNTVIPPTSNALRKISAIFIRLQEAHLPLEKLDLLLMAVSAIFETTASCNGQQLSADDFLPVLVLVVAHCGFIGAEIEAEYMWGLIQPSLLSGEAGYYLTALCSAVHVLKNFLPQDHEGISGSMDWSSNTLPECSSVLRVIIPDEYNGSIQTRTLPIRPHTTTREVCRIIAHKARITNAQDYGLFKLIDGEETLLQDNDCPQDVRMAACGKHCMIAYKRVDAKIAWPTAMPSSLTDDQMHYE